VKQSGRGQGSAGERIWRRFPQEADKDAARKLLKNRYFSWLSIAFDEKQRIFKRGVDTKAGLLFKRSSLAGFTASPPSQGIKLSKLCGF
jgi:hypothetical protein